MALQPATAKWHQADVDATVIAGYWLVRCSLYVMQKRTESTFGSAIR